MLIKKPSNLIIITPLIAILISGCSESTTESASNSNNSIATTAASAGSVPSEPSVQSLNGAQNPAAETPAKPIDLSPGKLPGMGMTQPGLMPGHVTASPH